MENKALRYRNIIRTLPLDEACNLIIELLEESHLEAIKNVNTVLYQNEHDPLTAAQEQEYIRAASFHMYRTKDIMRELLTDGLLSNLRTMYPGKALERDTSQHIIRLTNYSIDVSDIDEIYDEGEDTITLNGYIAGEKQVVTLTGSDARAVIKWLERERQLAQEDEEQLRRSSTTEPDYLPYQPRTIEIDEDLPF
jgi:hypothetical protein